MRRSHKVASLLVGLVVFTGAIVGFLSLGIQPGSHHPAHAQSVACGDVSVSLQPVIEPNDGTVIILLSTHGNGNITSAIGTWADDTNGMNGSWAAGERSFVDVTFATGGNANDSVAISGTVSWILPDGVTPCSSSVQASTP